MSYDKIVSFVNQEVEGVKPSTQGWMWIEESNPFEHFKSEIGHYSRIYKEHCRQFNVAVQAGGHMGMFPRIMGEIFKTVYTFEPDSLSFHCLSNNCQEKNIIKFNTALGNGGDLMYQSHYYYGNVGMNNYKTLQEGIEPFTEYFDKDRRKESAIANIPQVRLDDLNLSDCDLVHLDMEGNEHYAFDGMIKTIEKFKPLILFESGPTHELMDYIMSLGYDKLYNAGDQGWIWKSNT